MEWLKVVAGVRKGQILDFTLMVEPRGFADSMGGREETRMMPRSFGLSPSRSGVAI